MRFNIRKTACVLGLALTIVAASAPRAAATSLGIGFITWDVPAPGSNGSFDITNLTGANAIAFNDFVDFPVVSAVNLQSLSLSVDFSDGSSHTFGSSYFSLGLDGLSFNGGAIPIGGANPLPTLATLTGTFNPLTVTLFDATTANILPGFTAVITSPSGGALSDGDFAVISATTNDTGGAPVPEPTTVALLGTGLAGLASRKRRSLQQLLAAGRRYVPGAMLVTAALAIPVAASANVNQNTWTTPDNGVAGIDNVNVVASGFPSGTITPANVIVSMSASCGGAVLVTTPANSVQNMIGTVKRVNFKIPGSLATGIYFVQISDSAAGDANFGSNNCSQVKVTHTSATLSACVPTSSLGIVAPVSGPAAVRAVVPNGAWSSSTTGIQVVQLETGGGPVVGPLGVPTGTDVINSCAGNPATGESVCVANNAHVYHLNPSNVPTVLTSGSNATTGFSGGSCQNCGVAVNALTNQAVIAMGHAGSPSNSALQTLDLSTNLFGTPLDLFQEVSEDISIDPTRGYILSPNESSHYGIVQINSLSGAFNGEFDRAVSPFGTWDSAAEDCTTGIALTVGEFSNTVYMADLTQASFTAGTPGSWTGPQSQTTIIGSYSAGLSGVTVAPGTAHLATVTGEFGGSSFAVLQLPATSGSGTPSIVDYAYVTCINGFAAGLDPHTVTAYTSPNDGKAYTVFASGPPPATLAVVDMAAVLARPRGGDGHTVLGDAGFGACLANGDGIIRFVAAR